ncbi:MAG: tetratricopeptide repeat protein [Crocinitomicaceae bacterium]
MNNDQKDRQDNCISIQDNGVSGFKIMRLNVFRFLVILCFVMIATQSLAQNSIARQKAISLVSEGDNHLRLGGWQNALISYTNAIQTDPEYAVAYMKRGQLNERILRTNEAERDYNQAIYLNPLIDIFYDQRARLRILSFDYYGAVEDITMAINMNGNNVNYLKHQVDGFIAAGMYERALENLDSGEFSSSDLVYKLQRKGLVHLLNGDIPLAEKQVEEAYELDQTNYLTLDLLGLILLSKEDYTTALVWFNEAIASDSTQSISFYNRGVCYRFLDETDLALQDMNKSIELNNQQQAAFFKRALIRKEQGDLQGSIVDYKEAISLDSAYEDAIYNRSFTYKILGDFLNAEKDIDYLINTSENRPEYWNMKGNLQVLHGDIEGSLDSYNTAISLKYDYSDAFYNRGIAYLLLNRTTRACGDFQQSVDMGNSKAEEIILNFCGF